MRGRFEIRPNRFRVIAILLLLSWVFVIPCFFMARSGEPVPSVFGFLGLFFFGLLPVRAIPQILKRKITFILDERGIEQCYPQGSALIAWDNIEAIGIISIARNKSIGILLRNQVHYLSTVSGTLHSRINKNVSEIKWMGRLTSLLPVQIPAWISINGRKESFTTTMHGLGNVNSLLQTMNWSRQNYGFDFAFAWSEIDRSVDDFILLLTEYRKEYGKETTLKS